MDKTIDTVHSGNLVNKGITLIQINEKGILDKSKQAVDIYSINQAKEEIILIIVGLQLDIQNKEGRDADLMDLKNLIEKNQDIILKNEYTDSDGKLEYIEIIYKNKYNFIIDEKLNIVEKIEISKKDAFLDYNFKEVEEKMRPVKIKDRTQKSSDAELINAEFTEDRKGIVFDGSSSYGVLDSEKVILNCPLTITTTVKWENGNNNLLFIDANSKIAIGTWNNQMLLSVGKILTYAYSLPSDFCENEVNYITIQFNENIDDSLVYINGELMNKASYHSAWNKSEKDIFLGRRASGSFFKGILYDFKIYDKLFTEQEIIQMYEKQKQAFENNLNISDEYKEYLILDYLCNKNEVEYIMVPNILKSNINNKYQVKLNDVEYNDKRNGLIFNGSSSYGIVEDNILDMPFPNTITIVAKCNNYKDTLLFTNGISNIGIGLWDSKAILLERGGSNAIYYNIQSEFLFDDINYITVLFGSSYKENSLYVNGNKIENIYNGSGWNTSYTGDETYLGRRKNGSFFEGILYKLKIYSGNLTEDEIIQEYNEDKEYYSKNS